MRILITCWVLLLSQIAFGQCYSDRHNTNAHDGWISCEETMNPNPVNGTSHWILYNLGGNYQIYDIKIWNQSHPTFKNAGIKKLLVEYSSDSLNWNILDTFTLPRSNGISTYQGYQGIDFSGVSCQYVLLTAISNYGSACVGLSEIKIFTSDQKLEEFDLTFNACETDGILQNLSAGLEEGGIYSGPGVMDNGDESFDFDADLLGPGAYKIFYTDYNINDTQYYETTITVLPCDDPECAECPECDQYDQLAVDADTIPSDTYHGDSLHSIGAVRNDYDVNFRANNSITLDTGFTVDNPTLFLAEIRDCEINQANNPSFEQGAEDWTIVIYSTIVAEHLITDDAFEGDSASLFKTIETYTDTSGSLKWWQGEMRNQYFSMEEGQEYELSFAAKSDAQRKVRIYLQESVQPNTRYVDKTFNLKPYYETFSFRFVADKDIIQQLRFRFFCAYEKGDFYLDHLRLVTID